MRHISIAQRFLLLTLGTAWLALPLSARAAEPSDARRYKIEATFLFHFFNYITWPGYHSPEGLKSGTICIFNNDAVTPYLNYIQRKKSQERQLQVRQLHDHDSVAGCNLLFVRDWSALNTANIPRDTLIVSDTAGRTNDSSMIELTREEEHMAMSINHSLMEEHGFQVSSRLLSLAEGIE
jgi:hypothetical protein